MKRLTVIAITAASTLVLAATAVAAAFNITSDMYGQGILLLNDKQASECHEGGGCAVISVREMAIAEAYIRAQVVASQRGNPS